MFRYLLNRYVLGFFVLIALVLAGIHFTTPDRPWLTPLEKGLKDGLAPLQSGVTRVSGAIGEVFTSVFAIGRIKAENKLLNEKAAKLEAENNELREYGFENLRLRQLLDFKEERLKNFELVTAKVIGRNPDNWFSTMTINVGSNDGITKNMAVITGKGLVGRVLNVAQFSSEVMLIFDRSSSVGGLSQVTRTPGVLERGQDAGMLRMIHIPKDLPIREKQIIVTSGFGGIYPPNLPVGKVIKIETESNGLVKVAKVRPFVDFNRLEEVFVVKKTFARPGGQ